ncbi:MAG TPA: hypothetical protein VL492_06470 [Methylovirgula sp.]|jgi:hypothetical protein|nr:hypothetical protein [Methylovirgula sp.]
MASYAAGGHHAPHMAPPGALNPDENELTCFASLSAANVTTGENASRAKSKAIAKATMSKFATETSLSLSIKRMGLFWLRLVLR